ncbi:MAG: hypothetical protein ACREJO_15310 [Phycisphaerales bacterium]
MKPKVCPWSFFSGMLVPVLLGVLIFAQGPKPKPAPKSTASASIPIVLSPDYAQLTALLARLEALEAQRTSSQPWLRDVPASDPWAGFQQVSPAPRSTATARVPPVPKYTLPAGTAENGSYYGQPNDNGVPKTVYVNGYYHRDGTYVRGHYRSAPDRIRDAK